MSIFLNKLNDDDWSLTANHKWMRTLKYAKEAIYRIKKWQIKFINTKISIEMDFKGLHYTITFIYVSTLFISGNLFYKSLKSTS